jgi:hypothetical protein
MRRTVFVLIGLIAVLTVMFVISRLSPTPYTSLYGQSTPNILAEGRKLFDAWQNPETRDTVQLTDVARTMHDLEKVRTSDPLYATARRAIEVLRPIRLTLAGLAIQEQKKATDEAMLALEAKRAPEQTRIAEDEPGRREFAKRLEHLMLNHGRDVYVSASGPRATTLTIRYVLISRPLIHQLTQDGTFVSRVRDAGFRSLVMTDGYNNTWRWDLTKQAS